MHPIYIYTISVPGAYFNPTAKAQSRNSFGSLVMGIRPRPRAQERYFILRRQGLRTSQSDPVLSCADPYRAPPRPPTTPPRGPRGPPHPIPSTTSATPPHETATCPPNTPTRRHPHGPYARHTKKNTNQESHARERGGAAPVYFGLRLRSLFCGVPDARLAVAWQRRVVSSGSS